MSLEVVNKPNDWGQNEREQLLSIVSEFCEDFMENPSYENKERLITVTTFDEYSRHENRGLVRFTDYECALINDLYMKFKFLNFQYGINFLYDILFESAYLIKMLNMFPENCINFSDCYKGLMPYLKYFFMTSFYYHYNKQRTFADELINEIDIIEKTNVLSFEQNAIIFNNVLFDLSGKCNNHVFTEFNFSREDIQKLIVKSSELMKKANFKQIDRPHKGVLCMTISNFVLRSRNNYHFERIYKCVPESVVYSSFKNNELWMKRRSKLNDKREGRVIREIFSSRKWIQLEWAKTMKFTYERESFTCSFSTRIPTKKQREVYGKFVYGYTNDIVGPSITTLTKKINIESKKELASFSQFIMYDILYSRDEFKNEMNYLFGLINSFAITDEEKRFFLEEIIDYWKLTIKDKRWEYENERRYEIMHFDSYEYTECKIDDVFLKNKTPLLLYPDFIIDDNPLKDFLRENIVLKASYKNFGNSSYICDNCLFESSTKSHNCECPICKSKDISEIN